MNMGPVGRPEGAHSSLHSPHFDHRSEQHDRLEPDALCAICGEQGALFVFRGPDRLMRLPGEFQVVRCRRCATFYQWPRLPWSELQRYYEGDYDSYASAIQDEPSWLRRAVLRVYPRKMRHFVERFCQSGQLLDVGCGSGLFLEEMQRTGRWTLQGLEPTAAAANYVRQRFGIPVLGQTFEQADLPAESLDIITLWHVLEHVADPLLTLRKIWHALRPGGHLICSVPNYESLSRRLFGPYWVGWDLPRHLFIFPRTTLIALLEREGFQPRADACFMISYASLGHSLDFWQQEWPAAAQPAAMLLRRLYASPLGRLGSYPPQLLIEQLGLATVTTWAFQKVARHD
jgi:SAM-dependent methyltransferase